MAVITTHLFNISFARDDLIQVLDKIDHLSDHLYPQEAHKIASQVKGVSVLDTTNPYEEILEDLYKIYNILGMEVPQDKGTNLDIEIDDVKKLIADIYRELNQIEEIKKNLETERNDNLQILSAIEKARAANINIDEINACRYMTYRLGRVHKDQIEKIAYYNEYPFIYQKIYTGEDYVWVMYAALKHDIGEIDNVFCALSFEQIHLPNFVHGTLEEAYNELQEEANAMGRYIDRMNEHIASVRNTFEESLIETFKNIKTLKKLYNTKYVVDFSKRESIFAFSSLSREQIMDTLKHIGSVNILELPTDMYHARGIKGPIILENSRFFKPFEGLIQIQPEHSFDPTKSLALLLLLASGLLLGDLGVGVLVILIGSLLRSKDVGGILNRFGIALLAGGLLTGTIGYHWTLYPPIFKEPFSLEDAFFVWIVSIFIIVIINKVLQFITKRRV
mgnify:CR=1 FL=1